MHLTYFQRRITEVLPENAAEQLIIGKAVSVQYDIDRILLVIRSCKYGTDGARSGIPKGGSHVAFEKTTEVAQVAGRQHLRSPEWRSVHYNARLVYMKNWNLNDPVLFSFTEIGMHDFCAEADDKAGTALQTADC